MRVIRTRAVLAAMLVLGAMGVFGAGTAYAAPSSQDRAWIVAAHQSNLAEIAAGTAAQQQARSQSVKDLGAMFVQMHTTLDADLKKAAGQLGVALPGAPTPAQQSSLAAVKAKSGSAFDTAWVAQQIAGHRNTLAATQKELASGSDATVLALAKASTPVVQSHLNALLKLSGATTPSVVPAGSGGQAALVAQPTDAVVPTTPVAALAAAGALLLLVSAGWRVQRSRR
jgi:putative membrane protein